MNLQPLYDVKERLEAAAIAGTGLLGEDFRLQRAAEGLKPLAGASPVFAKIDGGLTKLLSAPAEARSGLLLDTLALVDAVVYTQGSVGLEGRLTPLPVGGGSYRQASCAQLQPLLTALTTTGGGRMETIKSAWDNHPELFADFRVLPALVAGLGDSYGEIADQNGRILRSSGPAAVPVLKEGFDPAGGKAMARRVQVMEETAGAAENDWYLEQLSQAKKPVRQALIFALRHDPANAQILAGLCQTEKKECQRAARFALARMETEESRAYWEALAQKDLGGALEAMRQSSAGTATDLTAGWFLQMAERVRENPNMPLDAKAFGLLGRLRTAMKCKTGSKVCDAFRAAANLGAALDRDYAYEENGRAKTEPMRFYCRGATTDPDSQRYFSAAMPFTLMRSIQLTRDSGLCALAGELAEAHGGGWIAPALCAALLTQDSAAAGQRAEELLRPKFKLFGRKDSDTRVILQDVLWGLCWNNSRYEYRIYANDPANNIKTFFDHEKHPVLTQELDPVWFELLMELGGLDAALMNLLRPMEHPVMDKVGKYLYLRATRGKNSGGFMQYVHALTQCGWKDWDGFVVKYAQAQGEVSYYSIQTMLNELPVPGKEKAAQLRAVNDLVGAKRLKAQYGRWPDAQIKQVIAQWENE
ncbi:hypothetical protein D1641_07215 [Colidextribacter sp. OB.20]|uniref:hypothetical protein n=1 Tax=Colidextribacter sp. OB.20 TaxID=2304568 RepID=UPI00136F2572|nr:hypothetical protein [Colidextribacter sp. OB.20]NBI09804.1 hypothetical protein [Colidextribacter sp. OB.20]